MGAENEGRREESEVRGNEQTVESGRATTSIRAGRKRPATTITSYSNALS